MALTRFTTSAVRTLQYIFEKNKTYDQIFMFQSDEGMMVPANINDRLADDTPLTDLEAEFFIFHLENPIVYQKIINMISNLKKTKISHYGMKSIFEFLRYEDRFVTINSNWMINNSFAPFYTRLYIGEYFCDIMDIKETQYEDWRFIINNKRIEEDE